MDFKKIAQAALNRAEEFLRQWLPDGRPEGREWVSLNPTRSDSHKGSFKVNIDTGRWSDFSSGDAGGDLISLYAYLYGVSQSVAGAELAKSLGVSGDRAAEAPIKQQTQTKPRSAWRSVIPVPDGIVTARLRHSHRGDPEQSWAYRDEDGRLLGHVCRFRTSDGGKEVLPLVFAKNTETGESKWSWLQWEAPRPLYWPQFETPERIAHRQNLPVLIVEGEKCAYAAYAAIGDRYDVCTWPGGGKATAKADWSQLRGRVVVIWPDCDAKREPLSRDEKAAGVSPESKPLLPEAKQPGIAAAEAIAQALAGIASKVSIVKIPAPGERPDGWDIADAVADGTDAEGLLAILGNLCEPSAPSTPAGAGAGKANRSQRWSDGDTWRDELVQKPRGGLEDCYQNVYLILKNHQHWRGIIAHDEFARRAVKLTKTPMGTAAGEWEAYDDLRLGFWLASEENVVIKGDGPLASGVAMIARENQFHPVRDYLDSLVWDGTNRLDYWLEECMSAAPVVTSWDYLRVAGRKALIAAVARIYRPGCKVDNMIIFEGGQGRGKSTAIHILGDRWFSDTQLDLTSKDAYMALKGVWFYEIGEMDSFNRADTTRVKGFVSSATDRYREPYERREIVQPRQQVFMGTTNQSEYFKDTTGNRRFWPVRVDGMVDVERLKEWRDQLFAEAVHRYRAGEIWHPTREEQETLFRPEQDYREVRDPWMPIIEKWLASPDCAYTKHLYVEDILDKALKIAPDRIGPARQEAMRVATIMARLGFEKKRETSGRRAYYYVMPGTDTGTDSESSGGITDEPPI